MSKLQTAQGRYDGAMEMKSKLYLRILLLIYYMMEENLFVYVECSFVKHAASRFSVRKNVTQKNKVKKKRKNEKKKRKKRKKVTPGYLRSRSRQFCIQKFHVLHLLTLHNPIKPLNIVNTNSFSWGPNFTSTRTWCTNDLRRLELSRINNSETKFIVLPSHLPRGNK